MAPDYPVEEWLKDVELLAYSDYWNDEAEEQGKPFWVIDGDFQRMEAYLLSVGLVQQIEACVGAAERYFAWKLHGVGCDLAAGSLWAEPLLLRLGAEKVYCVEYSRHRLLRLGPAVLAHYGVRPEQVVLALGDIHDLRLPSQSMDFVLMSSAFHHSDTPEQLLGEIRRILKPDAVIMLTAERIIEFRWRHYLRQPVKFLVSRLVPGWIQRRLLGRIVVARYPWPTVEDSLLANAEMGDHFYTHEQYAAMFARAGLRHVALRNRHWRRQAFVLARAD